MQFPYIGSNLPQVLQHQILTLWSPHTLVWMKPHWVGSPLSWDASLRYLLC